MSTNYHTPFGVEPATPGAFNLRVGELDAAISALAASVIVHDHTDTAGGGRLPFDALDVDAEAIGNVLKIVDIGAGVKGVRGVPPEPTASGEPVGVIKDYLFSTAPAGYVMADGRTIGSATSGATNRANADTEALFVALWNEYDNTVLVIQDSAGSATTRGASGAADFAADKRLPLPLLNGTTRATLDNLGGTSANRITNDAADTALGVMGAETHTLITSETPSHQHAMLAEGRWQLGVNAPKGHAGFNSQTTTIAINSVSSTSNTTPNATSSAGGGGAHNNVQPTTFVYTIISLGEA